MPHPRFYGTFPRIIDHYVREKRVLPLETAIHKMTGATARALKLKDRGLLREGFRADVAIFDPADFRDRATYADPHQYPTGARTERDRQRHAGGRERHPHRGPAGESAAAGRIGFGWLEPATTGRIEAPISARDLCIAARILSEIQGLS